LDDNMTYHSRRKLTAQEQYYPPFP
jgi:hypothetical protein